MLYLVLSKNKNRIPFNYNKVHNSKSQFSLVEIRIFLKKDIFDQNYQWKIAFYIQNSHFSLKNSI